MDQLKAYIKDLELKYEQLQAAHTQLAARHADLIQSKNDLFDTILANEAKERKYRTIIENSPGALFLSKPDGTILEVNRTACKMFGYTEEEFKHIHNTQLIDQQEPGFRQLIEERQKKGKARKILTAIRKNGERFQADSSAVLFIDPVSGEERTTAVMIDITESRKIQQALYESEQQYRDLFNLNPQPMWIYDYETLAFIEVNEAAIRHYGYSREDFLCMTIKDLTPPEDVNQLIADKNDPALNNSSPNRGKCRHLKKNGELIYVEITGQLITYRSHAAVLVLAHDISERLLVETELEAERNQLRTLIENLPDAIYIKDANARKIVTNKVDMAIMGISAADEVIGKTDFEIFEGEIGLRGYQDDQRILQKGETVYNDEQLFIDKNGKETWLLTSKVPIYNDEGNIAGLVGMGRIITERKRMEEALRQSNERFTYVTRATSDAIWDWDIENDFVYWGEGYDRIFGYSGEKRSADYIHSFDKIHAEDRAAIVEGLNKLINGTETNWMGEYRYLKASGEYAYVQDKAIVIRNDKGKAVRIIGAMQDITKRVLAEKELNEKNTQLKNLSSHLQHVREEERKHIAREVHDELGQLASVVKMDIDWLKIKMTDAEEAARKRIHHASATSDILLQAIRKIASSLRPGMLDELGLNASLDWQCKEFSHLNGIPCLFEQYMDDEDMSVQTKTELFRICQESLTNIMRHAEAKKVTVRLEEINNAVHLSIADNGKGFDQNAEMNTLGLIGMRERALSVKGELTIASEPGKGTTVSVSIPNKKLIK